MHCFFASYARLLVAAAALQQLSPAYIMCIPLADICAANTRLLADILNDVVDALIFLLFSVLLILLY